MQEVKNVFQDVEIVRLTVRDYGQMINKLRRAWETADSNEDVGTTSMLEEFIGSHEKTIWMLNSWLNKFTTDI
jgi:DNA-binding ferritin-like protein